MEDIWEQYYDQWTYGDPDLWELDCSSDIDHLEWLSEEDCNAAVEYYTWEDYMLV